MNSKNKQNELKSLYRQHSSGDAWGDAMSFAFPLCEILYSRDEHDVPELMKFRPSMGGVELNDECLITEDLKEYSTDELEAFGRMLNRLLDILKKKGMDY